MNDRPVFSPGKNVAMKVPPHRFEETVAFYGNVLGFRELEREENGVVFAFGESRRWIDRVPTVGHAELWLEGVTDDPVAASDWLTSHGIARCDGIERLPEDFRGFWIANPAGIVHLVAGS
jgi:catechol 2,3-dioxygenase-like lactoylglutathione lyase family enzyme